MAEQEKRQAAIKKASETVRSGQGFVRRAGPVAETDQQSEPWTIPACTEHGPLLGSLCGECGSGTVRVEDIEVVPAQVAERLAEASQAYIDAVRAYNAEGSKDAATRQSRTYQDLREAILSFRAGSSKEGQ